MSLVLYDGSLDTSKNNLYIKTCGVFWRDHLGTRAISRMLVLKETMIDYGAYIYCGGHDGHSAIVAKYYKHIVYIENDVQRILYDIRLITWFFDPIKNIVVTKIFNKYTYENIYNVEYDNGTREPMALLVRHLRKYKEEYCPEFIRSGAIMFPVMPRTLKINNALYDLAIICTE